MADCRGSIRVDDDRAVYPNMGIHRLYLYQCRTDHRDVLSCAPSGVLGIDALSGRGP